MQFIDDDQLNTGIDWFTSNNGKNEYDTAEAYELIEISYYALQKEQLLTAERLFKLAQQQFPDCNYIYNENALNKIGYAFLGAKKTDNAIFVFELITAVFPNSANAFDSLGEAYLINKNTALAIKNYKKSLELNPENNNAKQMLEKLEK